MLTTGPMPCGMPTVPSFTSIVLGGYDHAAKVKQPESGGASLGEQGAGLVTEQREIADLCRVRQAWPLVRATLHPKAGHSGTVPRPLPEKGFLGGGLRGVVGVG